MDDKIDESNVLLYAARFYDNPNCFDTVEFYDDLKNAVPEGRRDTVFLTIKAAFF